MRTARLRFPSFINPKLPNRIQTNRLLLGIGLVFLGYIFWGVTQSFAIRLAEAAIAESVLHPEPPLLFQLKLEQGEGIYTIARGKAHLWLNLQGLEPETEYTVSVPDQPEQTIKTDKEGKAVLVMDFQPKNREVVRDIGVIASQ